MKSQDFIFPDHVICKWHELNNMSIIHILFAHITYSVGIHDIYWTDRFPDIRKLKVHYVSGKKDLSEQKDLN